MPVIFDEQKESSFILVKGVSQCLEQAKIAAIELDMELSELVEDAIIEYVKRHNKRIVERY